MLSDLPNDQAEKAHGVIRENLARYQAPFSTGYETMGPAVAAPAQQQIVAAQTKTCPRCGWKGAPGLSSVAIAAHHSEKSAHYFEVCHMATSPFSRACSPSVATSLAVG